MAPFATVLFRFAAPAFRAAAAVARAVANRRRVLPLLELSDRELRDIGLHREDLRMALSMPLSRDPSVVLMVKAVDRRSRTRPVAMARLTSREIA